MRSLPLYSQNPLEPDDDGDHREVRSFFWVTDVASWKHYILVNYGWRVSPKAPREAIGQLKQASGPEVGLPDSLYSALSQQLYPPGPSSPHGSHYQMACWEKIALNLQDQEAEITSDSTGLELCSEEPKTFSYEDTTSAHDPGNRQCLQPPPSCPAPSQHWRGSAVISCEHLQSCPLSLPGDHRHSLKTPWGWNEGLSVRFYCVVGADSQLS